jgi:hypothetical protein
VQFGLRRCAGEDDVGFVPYQLSDLVLVESIQFFTTDDTGMTVGDADPPGDGYGGQRVVTGE